MKIVLVPIIITIVNTCLISDKYVLSVTECEVVNRD